ncbi:uncharacterized protein LOC143865146 [Tasmannia lanceolata]|uniref:uncharacterized protein LOC143850339 n=1 Tax=Tasmannia lanceolata TaxID=3420 RepID=UPI0040645352
MPRERDQMWEYAEEDGSRARCKFCGATYAGGISLLKYHWAQIKIRDVAICSSVLEFVKNIAVASVREMERKGSKKKAKTSDYIMKSSSSSFPSGDSTQAGSSPHSTSSLKGQPTITSMVKKKEKEVVDLLIMKSIIMNNLPFNLLRSDEFKEELVAIANHGPGHVPPSSETAITKLLGTLKEQVEEYIEEVKMSWTKTGCTLMSNIWTDGKNCPHINLLVASPKGVIFLKSECCVGKVKDASYVANFISSGIEEVGPENVVQVVADNGSNYVAAVDLMRVHTKGRDLQRPAVTRFATYFLCLRSILKQEEGLRYMVPSPDWRNLNQAKSDEGREVT